MKPGEKGLKPTNLIPTEAAFPRTSDVITADIILFYLNGEDKLT